MDPVCYPDFLTLNTARTLKRSQGYFQETHATIKTNLGIQERWKIQVLLRRNTELWGPQEPLRTMQPCSAPSGSYADYLGSAMAIMGFSWGKNSKTRFSLENLGSLSNNNDSWTHQNTIKNSRAWKVYQSFIKLQRCPPKTQRAHIIIRFIQDYQSNVSTTRRLTKDNRNQDY